ncbi:MAG: AAA family ATPase, partial [Acidobacteriota bacterium]
MAKKQRPGYLCRECGYRSAKWLGRCPQCEAWDSFEVESAPPAGVKTLLGEARRARVEPAAVRSLDLVEDDGVDRRTSAAPLIDRVLGGGVVPGGAVLLAGEPGIGKSTLLLQLGHALAGSGSGSAPEAAEDPPVLYVSAEESPRQLRLRAQRLGCLGSGLAVAGETEIEPILATVEARKPPVLLVDSVQALRAADLTGPPGSVSQVRHCAEQLVTVCKAFEIALFLVGHVTKDGAIAGPKSLEHLVDTVITFEGEGASGHRILRAQKNRFGPTGEVAMFEMRDAGLVPVIDPSKVLLARRQQHRPGSAVLASLHGSRPLLVEVQALVHPSPIPTPRRQAQGLDGTRA